MACSQESSSMETSSSDVNPLLARYKFDIFANRLDDDYFETLDEDFTSMLKKRGKLYSATKLRNIMLSEPVFKYFAEKLAVDLRLQETENLTSTSYIARIKALGFEGDAVRPIKIVVENNDPKNKDKGESVVFMAVFFSWQVDDSTRRALDLPYLFSVGEQKVLSSVNNLFEQYFGCKIMPVVLSQREIRWLMILILHLMSQESIKPMHVTYQMESNATKMNLTYSVAVLKEIWAKIHDEKSRKITYKEVCTLHNALEEHILETLRVDVSHFHMKRFSVTDRVTIDVSGKLFMATGDVIDLVYRFLNERLKCLGR